MVIPLRTLFILTVAAGVGYFAVVRGFGGDSKSDGAPAGYALQERFIPIEGLLEISSSDLKRSRLLQRIKTEMLSLECEERGLTLERDELVEHVRGMLESVRQNAAAREAMDRIRPGYWDVVDWTEEELDAYRDAVLSMMIAEDELEKNPITEEAIEAYRAEHIELFPNHDPEDVTDLAIRNDLIEENLKALSVEMRERYKLDLFPTAQVPEAIANEIQKELVYTQILNLGYFWVLRQDESRGKVEVPV